VETLKIAEENKKIIDHDSNTELNKDAIASMNMFGFTPSIFDHLDEKFITFLNERITEEKSEYFIPQVVKELIDEGKADVNVLRTSSKWFGITYQEDKPLVTKAVIDLIEKKEYPEKIYS
jgi:hypothetical protein